MQDDRKFNINKSQVSSRTEAKTEVEASPT
jgi:hypothetical protein